MITHQRKPHAGVPSVQLDVRYRDRQAATIENDQLRVTLLREGGHIAEIFNGHHEQSV
jgi:hypothetical protein